MQTRDWKWYERKITELFSRVEGADVETDVTEHGKRSGVSRQIDIRILVPFDIEVNSRVGFRIPITLKIIVDCKDYTKPLDVPTIGEIISLKEDVEAHAAIVVSPKGVSRGARKLAQSAGVLPVVVSHDLIAATWPWKKKDWEDCLICEWDMEDGIPNYIDWRNEIEGRCNRCNGLHARCPECHEVFGIPEGEYESPLRCPYDCGSAFYVEFQRGDKEIVEHLHVFDLLDCLLLTKAYNKTSRRLTRKEYDAIVRKTRWQYWEEARPEIDLTEEGLMEWTKGDCLHITSAGVAVFKHMIQGAEYPICF